MLVGGLVMMEWILSIAAICYHLNHKGFGVGTYLMGFGPPYRYTVRALGIEPTIFIWWLRFSSLWRCICTIADSVVHLAYPSITK